MLAQESIRISFHTQQTSISPPHTFALLLLHLRVRNFDFERIQFPSLLVTFQLSILYSLPSSNTTWSLCLIYFFFFLASEVLCFCFVVALNLFKKHIKKDVQKKGKWTRRSFENKFALAIRSRVTFTK